MGRDFAFEFKPNRKLARQFKEVLVEAMEQTLELDILPEAKRKSPFKTGLNRRSIDGDVLQSGIGGLVEGKVFTTSGYGGELEIGSNNRPPRPYLRPAVEKHAKRIMTNARKLLRGLAP